MPPTRASRMPGTATLPDGVRRDRIEPLWDRIDRNRAKVAAFLVVFTLAVGVTAAVAVGGAMFLVGVVLVTDPASGPVYFAAVPWVALASFLVGALGTAAYSARMMTSAERRLLARFGARRSEVGEAHAAKSALHDMSLAAGYEYPPPLWVIDECDRVNAFAVGLDERSTAIGVTAGFLDRLTEADMRATFANLMSRVRAGDTLWATSVSVVMGPIWKSREGQYRAEERGESPLDGVDSDTIRRSREGAEAVAAYIVLFALAVVVTELMMAGHERAAMAAAEKADAEGMLLLKDPREMLAGLTKVLEANNTVLAAGEAYSMLFYCWAGFGYAPEDDPEMERVSRLREVLGPEGLAGEPRPPGVPAPLDRAGWAEALPPEAPRLGERSPGERP